MAPESTGAGMSVGVFTLIVIAVIILASAIRILREYERGVIFRLGRLVGEKGPGLILLIPIIDRMVKVPLRVVALDIPPQDVITDVLPQIAYVRGVVDRGPAAVHPHLAWRNRSQLLDLPRHGVV